MVAASRLFMSAVFNTQRPDFVKRLNPHVGSERLVKLVTAWDHEIKEMTGGMVITP